MIKALRLTALTLFLACIPMCSIASAEELDLGSRVNPLPSSNQFSIPGFHVWCGAPVKGSDGKFHLFYSRWPVEVGFAPGWALHSQIAYAVADKPNGPYQHVNITLPPRGINSETGQKYWDADVTHNPNAFLYQGRYYIYYTGQHGDGKSYPMHRNHQRIGVAVADSPEGPWTRFDNPVVDITDDRASFDSLCVTNPAACLRPDGGVLLIYKAVQFIEGKEMGGNVRYGVAIAEKPEGPFKKLPAKVFESSTGDKHWMLAEDPFIWFSKKYHNRYYAIARDVVGSFSGAKGGICLFESIDGLDWRPAKNPRVLDSRFKLEDGSLSQKNLERPALLFDDGEPTYLFGATDGYMQNKPSSNVQIPLSFGVSKRHAIQD